MPLDIDELIEKKKKIYVKNTSRPMGHIVLTFVTTHGKSVPRDIPRTWIPICLTDTLSPEVIANSNELRQFINKGILKLVSPEDAVAELGQEDAVEESTRLNLSNFAATATATDNILAMQNQYTPEANALNPMMGPEGMSDPVNNRVKATLLRVEASDLTEREAVADLRIMTAELSSHDLTYIISQTESAGPLRRFAHQLLSEHQARVEPDVVENTTMRNDVEEPTEDPAEDPAAAAAGRASQQI
jgi:hypothetical protein